jgi:D-alanyl-D-alanine carboxypeptidase (penicillin-binding protein 5/6)
MANFKTICGFVFCVKGGVPGRLQMVLPLLYIVCCGPMYAENVSQDIGAVVVMNAKTGRILVQKAAHQKLYPASTTKIATLAYILSSSGIDIHQKIVVPSDAVKSVLDSEKSRDNFSRYPSYILEARGSIAGFKAGEVLTVEDALYGAMLPSGNDAANTLAYYWGNKSIESCVEQINRFVESIGCTDTHFENPHGLHHPNHVSSAYDLALIAAYGLQNALFAKVVSTVKYTKGATNKQPSVTWHQSNRLLLSGPLFCKWASGVKTGSHNRAQNCFVGSGSTEDRSIIVVLLHCPDRKIMSMQAKRYLEKFLQEAKVEKSIVDMGRIGLTRPIEGQPTSIPLRAVKSCSLQYYSTEEPSVTAIAEWLPVRFPIQKGEKLGTLRVYADGKEIDSVDLLSEEARRATWSQKIASAREKLKTHTLIVVLMAVGMGVGIMTLISRSRPYRRR